MDQAWLKALECFGDNESVRVNHVIYSRNGASDGTSTPGHCQGGDKDQNIKQPIIKIMKWNSKIKNESKKIHIRKVSWTFQVWILIRYRETLDVEKSDLA